MRSIRWSTKRPGSERISFSNSPSSALTPSPTTITRTMEKMGPKAWMVLQGQARAQTCHPRRPCLPPLNSGMHLQITASTARLGRQTIHIDRYFRTIKAAPRQRTDQMMATSRHKNQVEGQPLKTMAETVVQHRPLAPEWAQLK